MRRTNLSLKTSTKSTDGYTHALRQNKPDLPSFGGSYFQRKALAAHEVDVIVEDAAQIDEVVRVDGFDRVGDFFLESGKGSKVKRKGA